MPTTAKKENYLHLKGTKYYEKRNCVIYTLYLSNVGIEKIKPFLTLFYYSVLKTEQMTFLVRTDLDFE